MAIKEALANSDLVYPKKVFIEMVEGASAHQSTATEAVGLLEIKIKGA
jgi:hypothetical protein